MDGEIESKQLWSPVAAGLPYNRSSAIKLKRVEGTVPYLEALLT